MHEKPVCTANVIGVHTLASALGSPMRTVGGFYSFGLSRSAGGWKINRPTFTLSWADGNFGILALAESPAARATSPVT